MKWKKTDISCSVIGLDYSGYGKIKQLANGDMEKDINSKKIIISLIGFIIYWTIITNAWGYSDFIFKNDVYNVGSYIYGYLCRVLWVIPAIILILKYNTKLSFDKTKLFSCPKFLKELIIVLILSMSYVFIGMFAVHKGFNFNNDDLLWLVVQYLEVGFAEETVFRGWGYNALLKYSPHIKAASITTALFVILHWPAYFIKFYRFGIFDFAGIIGQSTAALFWGFVLCWLLKKGKSIWNPIIAHSLYDLAYILFVG